MRKTVKLLLLLLLLISCGASGGDDAGVAGTVNVMAAGARGDGVSDDTAAINAALATGKTVIFPNTGSAYIYTALSMPNGAHVKGMGYPVLKSFAPGGHIDLSRKTDVVIEGIEFDGSSNIEGSWGIVLGPGSKRNVIRNNKFTNYNLAVYVTSSAADPSDGCAIEKNSFGDNIGSGIYVSISKGLIISENIFNAASIRRPILLTGSANAMVTGNVINGSAADTVTGIWLGYNPAAAYVGNSDNIISGNVVSGIMEEGISIDQTQLAYKYGGAAGSSTYATLGVAGAGWTANEFYNYYITIVSGTGVGQYRRILGNTGDVLTVDAWDIIPDTTSKFQISMLQTGNVIRNNTVSDTGLECILIYGAAIGNAIEGNTVSGCNLSMSPVNSMMGIRGVHRGAIGAPLNDRSPAFYNRMSNNTFYGAGNAFTIDVWGAGGVPDWTVIGNIEENNLILPPN